MTFVLKKVSIRCTIFRNIAGIGDVSGFMNKKPDAIAEWLYGDALEFYCNSY